MSHFGGFINNSIDFFEKDNRYMKLFFYHLREFYKSSKSKNDDFKGIPITYATKALANVILDHKYKCFPSIVNSPNLHGMVVSIQHKDDKLPEYSLREFIEKQTKDSAEKDDDWSLFKEGRNAYLNINDSYKYDIEIEELEPSDNYLLKKFASIYSQFDTNDLNVLITCRTFRHTLECVIFNVWDWYQNHFNHFLSNKIPLNENEEVNLFDESHAHDEELFILKSSHLNSFRYNLLNMATHIKLAEEKLILFESERRKKLVKFLIENEHLEQELVQIIVRSIDITENIPDTAKSITYLIRDLQDLTSLIRSICSHLAVKTITDVESIKYLEKSNEPVHDFKKKKNLVKYINQLLKKLDLPRTFQYNIINYIDSFNNSKNFGNKIGHFNNILSILKTLYKRIKEINEPYLFDLNNIEEITDYKFIKAEINLSEQRSRDPILYIKNLTKQISRITPSITRIKQIQFFIKILLERSQDLELIVENKHEKLAKNRGYFIDFTINNKSVLLNHFGKKNLVRWIILDKEKMKGTQEKIESIEFELFMNKLRKEDYDYGLFVYEGKRQQYFDTAHRGQIDVRYDPIAAVDLLQETPVYDFLNIQNILTKNEKSELLNLILYFKDKIEKRINNNYLNTIKIEIKEKIISQKTKDLFDKILNEDDPYGLLSGYKIINENMIKDGINRHDIVHVLNVTKKSLEILELFHENVIESHSLHADFIFVNDLDYADKQTAFVLASLWHDLGLIGGRSHAIKSIALFNTVSDELLKILFENDLQKAEKVKKLIKVLIGCHTQNISDYDFNKLLNTVIVFNEDEVKIKIDEEIRNTLCNKYIEVCLFRFADILDTTYLRQNPEYLQILFEKNLDFSDEALKRDVLQHQFSILSVDAVLTYPINIDDTKLIKVEIVEDIFEDYKPKYVTNAEFRYIQMKYFGAKSRWSYLQPKITIIGSKCMELFTIYFDNVKYA